MQCRVLTSGHRLPGERSTCCCRLLQRTALLFTARCPVLAKCVAACHCARCCAHNDSSAHNDDSDASCSSIGCAVPCLVLTRSVWRRTIQTTSSPTAEVLIPMSLCPCYAVS
eukprot:2134481-Rhodomonas_salina.1